MAARIPTNEGGHRPRPIVGEIGDPPSGGSSMSKPPTKTLRDEFAMAALTGLLADSSRDHQPQVYVSAAYEYADAMLEARK